VSGASSWGCRFALVRVCMMRRNSLENAAGRTVTVEAHPLWDRASVAARDAAPTGVPPVRSTEGRLPPALTRKPGEVFRRGAG
jgi:hypothetical protein